MVTSIVVIYDLVPKPKLMGAVELLGLGIQILKALEKSLSIMEHISVLP